MVNFPTQIPDCNAQSPALFYLFIYPDPSICSTVTFHLLPNSEHVVSVSIDSPSNSKEDALFLWLAYDYMQLYITYTQVLLPGKV